MISLRREHHMMRRELEAEAHDGLIPLEHVDVVPYWLRRWRNQWLTPGVPKTQYIRALTTLAFRKHQLSHYQTPPIKLTEDVAALRERVRKLLARAHA